MKQLMNIVKEYNEEDKKTIKILINSCKMLKQKNENLQKENDELKKELSLLKNKEN